MKDIILDRIKKGGFNLPKVLERIDQMYIEEKITSAIPQTQIIIHIEPHLHERNNI